MFQSCNGIDVTLGNLPSDIIRKVVGMLPLEAVDCFLMISPKWNAFALALLSDKKELPVINRFMWNSVRDRDLPLGLRDITLPRRIYLTVRTKIRYRGYFGLSNTGYGNGIDEIATFFENFVSDSDTDVNDMRNCIYKIFARCSQIGRIYISESLCENLQIFKPILCNVLVKELSVTHLTRFNSTLAEILSDFIRDHQDLKLRLCFDGSTEWNSIKHDLSSFLRTATPSVEMYIKFNDNERKKYTLGEIRNVLRARIRELIADTNLRENLTFEDSCVRVQLKPIENGQVADSRFEKPVDAQSPRSLIHCLFHSSVHLIMFQSCNGIEVTLGNLPSDVIRKVVGMLPLEDVDGFRMISPKWNDLALLWLSDRTRLPAIYRFTWRSDRDNEYMTLRTRIRYRDYFGLSLWERDLGCGNSIDEVVEFNQDFISDIDTDDNRMRDCVNKIFARCSQIDRFELSEAVCEQFHVFKQTLYGVSVNELSVPDLIRFDSTLAEIFSEFIRSHSIQKLCLSINDSAIWNSIKHGVSTFLLTAINSVEIYIKFNDKERKKFEFLDYVDIWEARIFEAVENTALKLEKLAFDEFGARVHLNPIDL